MDIFSFNVCHVYTSSSNFKYFINILITLSLKTIGSTELLLVQLLFNYSTVQFVNLKNSFCGSSWPLSVALWCHRLLLINKIGYQMSVQLFQKILRNGNEIINILKFSRFFVLYCKSKSQMACETMKIDDFYLLVTWRQSTVVTFSELTLDLKRIVITKFRIKTLIMKRAN